MAKFCGKIGYATMVEESPGVWVEKIVERQHFGNWVSNTAKLQAQESLNEDLVIANDLSIVAALYAKKTFHSIRYATYRGTKGRVRMVKEASPRLTLVLGGVYNDSNGNQ